MLEVLKIKLNGILTLNGLFRLTARFFFGCPSSSAESESTSALLFFTAFFFGAAFFFGGAAACLDGLPALSSL